MKEQFPEIKKDRTFNNWTTDELFHIFGLKPKEKCILLEKWLTQEETLSQFELDCLEFFRIKAKKFIHSWKEADLRDNFLGPIISLANFYSEELRFSTFSECYINTKKNSIPLKGTVEWLVAMGLEYPRTPFFFIHVPIAIGNKPQIGGNDNKGQLLAAMLAAQSLNQQPTEKYPPYRWIQLDGTIPIYGCTIIGQFWWFVVLKDKEFCFSEAYNAVNQEQLIQIFKILKAQKQIISKHIKQLTKTI